MTGTITLADSLVGGVTISASLVGSSLASLIEITDGLAATVSIQDSLYIPSRMMLEDGTGFWLFDNDDIPVFDGSELVMIQATNAALNTITVVES